MEIKKYIKKAKKKSPRLFSAAKFLIKFNLLAIPLYIAIIFGIEIQFLKDITSGIIYSLLHATGMNAAALPNNMISIPIEGGSWAASIDWDCTGWKSMYLLFALMFATDFQKRKKTLGLLLIPIAYAINILRIWFMFFYVSSFGLAYYSFVHAVVWSWGMLIIVLLLWIFWMKLDFRFVFVKRKQYIVNRINKQYGHRRKSFQA